MEEAIAGVYTTKKSIAECILQRRVLEDPLLREYCRNVYCKEEYWKTLYCESIAGMYTAKKSIGRHSIARVLQKCILQSRAL